MAEPIKSVAGIRGIIGESCLPDEWIKYVLAFASLCEGKRIIVGGDSRLSRDMLRHVAFSALISSGYEAIDLDVCPTPTVGMVVRELHAKGGIAITASHNPKEWNGYKFFNSSGVFLSKEENARLFEKVQKSDYIRSSIDNIGWVKKYDKAIEVHLRQIFKVIKPNKIRKKRFKVVVDACNGAASVMLPMLMEMLNCDATLLNTDINKEFPHVPEPLPENIRSLCNAVKKHHADIGFAIDPDADRLAIVDENGNPIGEERTVTLGTYFLLSRMKSPIAVNLSTTQAMDDVAQIYDVPIYRTPIGEINVVAKLMETGAFAGGEGNGGLIVPSIHPGRDAATAMVVILEALTETKKPISLLNSQIPDYTLLKIKHPVNRKINFQQLLEKTKKAFPKIKEINETDGLKFVFEKSWIHVRPSGTEPIVRIFAEARTREEAEALINKIRGLIG